MILVNADSEYKEPLNKAHGRIEVRETKVFSTAYIFDKSKWEKIKSIIQVNRVRTVFDTKEKYCIDKNEVSYYVSTEIFSAEVSNTIVRNHWGIENKNHYIKDETMKEDSSRIRVNPQNIARLRSFALNILRFNNVTNISNALYNNALDFKALMNLSGLIDD